MADVGGGGGLPLPVVDFIFDSVRDVFGPQPRRPTPADEAVLRDAGWQYGTNRSGGFVPGLILPGRGAALAVWQSPSGEQFSRDAARRAAEQIRANPPAPGPPGPLPPGPDNPPIPQPGAANNWFVPGSIFWGSRGPTRRPRVKRKRKKKNYGGVGRAVCGTDSQCEEWCADFPDACARMQREYEAREASRAFVGNPDAWPVVAPVLPKIVRAIPRVLGRVLGPIGWILFPSRTADDDVWQPSPRTPGPPRRPRVGRPYPYAWPLPDFQGKWRKRPRPFPGVLYPDVRDRDRPAPLPRTDTRRVPSPWPQPAALPRPQAVPQPQRRPGTAPGPRPSPSTRPRPSPRPSPFPGLPTWLPYLAPFAFPSPTPRTSRPAQPRVQPPPVQSPLPIENPLTQPYSYRANYCPPCESDRQRKRKKDSCTNPISGKRTFTRGGVRFRTITRKLQCPV